MATTSAATGKEDAFPSMFYQLISLGRDEIAKMDQDMWNAVVVEWFIGFVFDRYERKCSNKEEGHNKKKKAIHVVWRISPFSLQVIRLLSPRCNVQKRGCSSGTNPKSEWSFKKECPRNWVDVIPLNVKYEWFRTDYARSISFYSLRQLFPKNCGWRSGNHFQRKSMSMLLFQTWLRLSFHTFIFCYLLYEFISIGMNK